MEHHMRLHENTILFRQSIEFTAQKMNILPIYIEKDYWVTFALHTIFHSQMSVDTVFKGGTALSKCFGIIERFSEDIDLVVLQYEGDTPNKLKGKLKQITEVVSQVLDEIEIDKITNKRGMIRKISYQYPKIITGLFGQVRDVIIVEATWLGRFEPYQKQQISSYIYEMMQEANQLELAKEYGMFPFEVQVLHVNRTICEKIMSLVRFSYRENPIEDLQNKIRHAYDIHQLLKEKDVKDFFNSSAFDEMLLLVAQDDIASFKKDNSWLEKHPKNACIYNDTENVWKELKSTYNNEFSNLVYGKLPIETEILQTLKDVSTRLKKINWTIKIETQE
jgi:predicted nucleotidyltransferase component of viral defense system